MKIWDLNTELCFCHVTLFSLSFSSSLFSDPTVSRYHVQWMPEYCSHNETRGPEKSVTQVGLRETLHTFQPEIGSQSAQSYDLISSTVLCKARGWAFVRCLERRAPLEKKTPPSWARSPVVLDLLWANHWLLFWILWVSRVVRHVVCRPIKCIYCKKRFPEWGIIHVQRPLVMLPHGSFL